MYDCGVPGEINTGGLNWEVKPAGCVLGHGLAGDDGCEGGGSEQCSGPGIFRWTEAGKLKQRLQRSLTIVESERI